MQKMKFLTLALLIAVLCTPSALAHVTLENQQAPIGSTYKAVFRVPHGCKGNPTTKSECRSWMVSLQWRHNQNPNGHLRRSGENMPNRTAIAGHRRVRM